MKYTRHQSTNDCTYMRSPERSKSDKESRMNAARGWGLGGAECLMGTVFPFRMMESFWR